jgi:transcriptional regulator with XRE-family HTH domain
MLGKNIKIQRITKGYSQGQLSKELGISQTYLSLIEREHKLPSLKLLINLSKVLEYKFLNFL